MMSSTKPETRNVSLSRQRSTEPRPYVICTQNLVKIGYMIAHRHTHTHSFNCLLSGTTTVSRYQKGKTNLDFTEARDSEWQWHQLDHMQVCTLLQTNNHTSTPPLCFLQAGCPFCRPTNSVKALKAYGSEPVGEIIDDESGKSTEIQELSYR